MKHKALFILTSLPTLAFAQQSKPNIILILADDMGYSDIGCMGGEIETPNIDALAQNGVLFTNFYNTSRSCPSRAALLTGQYQWDVGMGHMTDTKSDLKEYQGYLNNKCITIAEALKLNGYRTFMSGKWHLGDAREHWPDKRGFDQFYGIPAGGGVYFYPSSFYERTLYHNGKEVFPNADWYSTDGFTDAAIDFIRQDENKQQPFFMYIPYIAPHFPLQAKEIDIAKYEKCYQDGYESTRKKRIKKQEKLGIIDKDFPIPEPLYPAWESVNDKQTESRKMAVYAAMVDCMDQNIGRLVEELKKNKLYENTVIIFLSDNGGASANFNKTPHAEIGSRESNATYGIWHNVSNTPLRYGKSKEHEGGIKTPLIIQWPAGLKRSNIKTKEMAHIMDVMPTCLELAGGFYPEKHEGSELSPLEGKSFLSLARGEQQDKDRIYFWEHEGNKAVRQGDWKLVKLRKNDWELYHIGIDPFEVKNIIKNNPEIARQLEEKYNRWAIKHKVSQWPLPKSNRTD